MPRNNNQPNRRLGQVNNMVRNTQDERQERLNSLLGRNNIITPPSEPRNREERRERGIRNSIDNENINNHNTSPDSTQYTISLGGITYPVSLDVGNFTFDSASWNIPRNHSTSQNKYIKRYDYVPDKFNFHHTKSDYNETCVNLYMGVELEIDGAGESDDNAKFIQEFLGEENCYIMHDGSLSRGLEITTHPCSLNYHKSLPYSDLFNALVKMGYKSHDTQTCGLHIHVNRNFFGEDPTIQDLCTTKVLYLLEKHWENVKVIARRDSSRYAERFFMKEDESMFNLLSKAKGNGYGSAKYQIVNLIHKNTIEFRMCRGTLKYETFIATLEFIRNLVYLCKNKPLEQIQMVTFEEIIYVLDTEYLINYIKERGIKILENIAM